MAGVVHKLRGDEQVQQRGSSNGDIHQPEPCGEQRQLAVCSLEKHVDTGSSTDVAALLRGQLAHEYPYITEVAVIESANHDADSTLGWCDDQVEFQFGLDLLLDGLERLHNSPRRQR